MRRPAFALALVAALASGCATAASSVGAAAATSSDEAAARITAAEIAAADVPTAYELVDRLRRPWLRRAGSGGPVVVYLDDRPIGGVEALRDHPSVTVAELRYVTHEEAMRRWGGDVAGAVIVVVPRR